VGCAPEIRPTRIDELEKKIADVKKQK